MSNDSPLAEHGLVTLIRTASSRAIVSDDAAIRWWAMRCMWFLAVDRPREAVAVAGAPTPIRSAFAQTDRATATLTDRLVLNPDCPGETLHWALWKNAIDEHDTLLFPVASHPNALPVSMRAIANEFLDYNATDAHGVLLRRHDVPDDVVERLLAHDEREEAGELDYAEDYLCNPRHDPTLLADLADLWLRSDHSSGTIWPDWIRRGHLLPVAPDDDRIALHCIASNPSTPLETIERLVKEIQPWYAIARNPSAPAEILHEAARQTYAAPFGRMENHPIWWTTAGRSVVDVGLHDAVALNPSTAPADLLALAAFDARMAALTARNPACNSESLLQLPARALLSQRHRSDLARSVPAHQAMRFVSLAVETADAGPSAAQVLAML